MQLNYEKLQYNKDEADFFGETYTASGHMSAQSKVSSITAMPAPTCKKQVQSFIGMINYLSKFSAKLSELVKPIRELSKEKVPFSWSSGHWSAFTLMKKEIASVPVLAYYNPKKQTLLQTDTSIKRVRCMFAARCKPSLLCQQSFNRCTKGLCCHRVRVISSCVVHGEVAPLLVHKPLHLGD